MIYQRLLKSLQVFLFAMTCMALYVSTQLFFPTLPLYISQLIGFFIPSLIGIFLFLDGVSNNLRQHKPTARLIGLTIVTTTVISLGMVGLTNLASFWPPIQQALDNSLRYLSPPYFPWQNKDHLIQICLMPALCEELLFRGVIQNALKQAWGIWPAIVLTSLLFGLFHFQIVLLPFYFLLGLYLGFLQSKTNTIAYPMIAHFTNNFVGLTVLGIAN